MLLDGQFFRNALIFFACILASASLWVIHVRRDKNHHHRRLTTYALLAHAVMALFIAVALPGRLQQQKRHDAAVERALDQVRQHAESQED